MNSPVPQAASSWAIPPIGFRGRALDFVPISEAKQIAAELEQLGYGVVWLPELAGRDVFVHLTQLLSSTRTLVGGSAVATIWARDALAMSCAANSLAESFPDRVLVGLGVGHRNLVEAVRGHTYGRPLGALTEYLEAMDQSPYRAERPMWPARRLIGALGPAMLRLAADRTEGACPYLTPPEHTAWARELMGPTALLCPDLMVVLERDRAKAREIARSRLAAYFGQPNYAANLKRFGFADDDLAGGGSDRLVDAVVAMGSVDDIIRRVDGHFAAGADHVAIQPLTAASRAVPLAQWRELAPALRDLRLARSAPCPDAPPFQ